MRCQIVWKRRKWNNIDLSQQKIQVCEQHSIHKIDIQAQKYTIVEQISCVIKINSCAAGQTCSFPNNNAHVPYSKTT